MNYRLFETDNIWHVFNSHQAQLDLAKVNFTLFVFFMNTLINPRVDCT